MSKEAAILGHLERLVGYKTVSSWDDSREEVEKAFDYVVGELDGLGLVVERYDNKGSLSCVVSTEKTLTPDVMILTHMDVVGGGDELFKMKREGDRVLGRGVADMKFAIAVGIELMKEVKKDGLSVALVMTSDEEIGSMRGAKYLADEVGWRPGFMVVPDGGTGWKIVERAKGAMHVGVKVHGATGHASRPWEGESAIDKMVGFLGRMRGELENPKEPDWQARTMNIGVIKGGTQGNQIASDAEVLLDLRFPQKQDRDELLGMIRERVPDGSEVEVVVEAYAFELDRDNNQVQRFVGIMEEVLGSQPEYINEYGATDARFFNKHGVEAVITAPPYGGMHMEEEWIEVEGIVIFYQMMKIFLGIED